MTSTRRFHLPRFVVAVLAALGLLASSARTLLACTMPGAQPEAVAEVDSHAHHHAAVPATESVADSMAEQEHGAESDEVPAPEHERCPDLAHCAVMAWTPLPPLLPGSVPAPERRVAAADARPLSVGRAIDTPPPKRG